MVCRILCKSQIFLVNIRFYEEQCICTTKIYQRNHKSTRGWAKFSLHYLTNDDKVLQAWHFSVDGSTVACHTSYVFGEYTDNSLDRSVNNILIAGTSIVQDDLKTEEQLKKNYKLLLIFSNEMSQWWLKLTDLVFWELKPIPADKVKGAGRTLDRSRANHRAVWREKIILTLAHTKGQFKVINKPNKHVLICVRKLECWR